MVYGDKRKGRRRRRSSSDSIQASQGAISFSFGRLLVFRGHQFLLCCVRHLSVRSRFLYPPSLLTPLSLSLSLRLQINRDLAQGDPPRLFFHLARVVQHHPSALLLVISPTRLHARCVVNKTGRVESPSARSVATVCRV